MIYILVLTTISGLLNRNKLYMKKTNNNTHLCVYVCVCVCVSDTWLQCGRCRCRSWERLRRVATRATWFLANSLELVLLLRAEKLLPLPLPQSLSLALLPLLLASASSLAFRLAAVGGSLLSGLLDRFLLLRFGRVLPLDVSSGLKFGPKSLSSQLLAVLLALGCWPC